MELAVATRIGPLEWQAALDADPMLVTTALEVLRVRAQELERARRRR